MQRTQAELDMVLALFEAAGSPKSMENLRWQYWKPEMPLLVDCYASKAEIGALYALSPVRFRVGSAVVLGAQSIDTMTAANHRGQGLFVSMAKALYPRASSEQVKLSYGFPNLNSAHGFFNHLDWTNMGPLPLLMRPLHTKYWTDRFSAKYLRRFGGLTLPDVTIPLLPQRHIWPVHTVTHFDERFTQLWHDTCSDTTVGVERDAGYLRWRLSKPNQPYQTLAIFDRDTLFGYVTFVVNTKRGGRLGYVMELQHSLGRGDAGAQLLHAAMRSMQSQKADAVLAWVLPHSPQRKVYRRAGFAALPVRMHPAELHFGARVLHHDTSVSPFAGVTQRCNWYLSYLDSDSI
jgi:hypothetical protein